MKAQLRFVLDGSCWGRQGRTQPGTCLIGAIAACFGCAWRDGFGCVNGALGLGLLRSGKLVVQQETCPAAAGKKQLPPRACSSDCDTLRQFGLRKLALYMGVSSSSSNHSRACLQCTAPSWLVSWDADLGACEFHYGLSGLCVSWTHCFVCLGCLSCICMSRRFSRPDCTVTIPVYGLVWCVWVPCGPKAVRLRLQSGVVPSGVCFVRVCVTVCCALV